MLPNLIGELEQFLGWNNVNDAFLVGAGSMGAALMGYRKFEQCGLKIVAAFDGDPAKIGARIHGRHVVALHKLPNLAQRMHILIGILTVPAAEAQAVADMMVAGGIRAIWNLRRSASSRPITHRSQRRPVLLGGRAVAKAHRGPGAPAGPSAPPPKPRSRRPFY